MNLELGAGLKLDSSIIPRALRYLIPTIERFGFSSQELQDEFVGKMQKDFPQQLAEFNRKIDDAREKIIEWGKELVELNKHKDEIDETTWHHPYWSFLDALKVREITEPPNSPLENDVIKNAAAEARSSRLAKVSEKASETRATMLDSFECQEFAFQVMQHGKETFDSCLQFSDVLGKSQLPKCIMACEIVAAACGHPVKAKQWSFFAEQWLYESKYKPDPEGISNATRLVKQVAKQKVDYDIQDLIARLEATPEKIVRKKVSVSANEISKFAKEHKDKVAWSRTDADLYMRLENFSCYVQRLIPFGQFKSIRLWIDQPPTTQHIDAFRIFLLACQDSLENIEISRSIPQTDMDTDPEKILQTSVNELALLTKLTGFLCEYVYSDNRIIEAVASSGKLKRLRLDHYPNSKVNKDALEILMACKHLRMLDICAAGFPLPAAIELNKAIPNVNILGYSTDKIVTPEWAR